ncbi:hypothetical protein FA13DRAFT_1726153 [Coprinellus micaceus]|uniref:Uncharacterized protein n=1 Tax=Coprinellus micaceus TaxID=71717 RepID=A0A4Y7TWC0_COPMI|nr:hypothetical protein FA13DRAFT_1726153 [Coprinellus micaceus]
MSDSQSSQNASQQQQQQQRVRKPPFANWPTFKILTPPQGPFSPKTDEWCITWCRQSISGRIHGKEPECRSISIRKVYPHEIRNVVSFKRHRRVSEEGQAQYPLPAEGQAANLPRVLGGLSPDDAEDDRPSPASKTATKFWQEGWYFWTTTSRQAAMQKTQSMKLNLDRQQAVVSRQQQMRDLWQDYQDDLSRGLDKDVLAQKYGGKVFGSIAPPPMVMPEESFMIHLPPELPPLWGPVQRFLAPSWRALDLLRESITSGQQKEFAIRTWKKAQTGEPFELARRTCSKTYERWKTKDATDDEDGKNKPST